MRFELRPVEFMPSKLQAGILYYSAEFGTAAHLCACNCGTKIRTPIGPTEWSIKQGANGPTLKPSIGNWQRPCRSHYFISDGSVLWANQWSLDAIDSGRRNEELRRRNYYDGLYQNPRFKTLRSLWGYLTRWF
jgi:Family of unknown function (DUF6527)